MGLGKDLKTIVSFISLIFISCNNPSKQYDPFSSFIQYANSQCSIKYGIMPFSADSLVLRKNGNHWSACCRNEYDNFLFECSAKIENSGFITSEITRLSKEPIYFRLNNENPSYFITNRFRDSIIYSKNNFDIFLKLPHGKIRLSHADNPLDVYQLYEGYENYLKIITIQLKLKFRFTIKIVTVCTWHLQDSMEN